MSASGSQPPKGPLFNLFFCDVHVGRIVQHKQDHREGVIKFPVYNDYNNNLAPAYAVCFAGSTHGLEEVSADKLSISESFAEDTNLVPASILELQRNNWYQPRFTTTGLEGLLGVTKQQDASGGPVAKHQPAPAPPALKQQDAPSGPASKQQDAPSGPVSKQEVASQRRAQQPAPEAQKQLPRPPHAASPSSLAPEGPKQHDAPAGPASKGQDAPGKQPASQAQEQLPQHPQDAPCGPLAPPDAASKHQDAPAAAAPKRQGASRQRAQQPAPAPPAPMQQDASAASASKRQVASAQRAPQAAQAPAPKEQDSPADLASKGQDASAAPATRRQIALQRHAQQPAPALPAPILDQQQRDSPGVQFWFGGTPSEQGAVGKEGQTGTRKRKARSEPVANDPGMEEDWVQGWTGTRYPKSAAYKPGDIPASEIVAEEGTFEVDQILDEYKLKGVMWYLPKWKGYELRPGSGAAGLNSGDAAQKGDWEPEWCIPKAVRNEWNRLQKGSHSVGDSPAAASGKSRKKR